MIRFVTINVGQTFYSFAFVLTRSIIYGPHMYLCTLVSLLGEGENLANLACVNWPLLWSHVLDSVTQFVR